jgi:hypothetical protein
LKYKKIYDDGIKWFIHLWNKIAYFDILYIIYSWIYN